MTVRTFTAQPLTGEMALQAYPLIQVTRGDLSLEEWRDFVRDQQSRPSADGYMDAANAERGIMALINPLGYLQGLYSYHVRDKLVEGPVLEVENVVALDLFRPSVAAEALHHSMHETACRLSCHSLHVVVADGDGWLKHYFDEMGFRLENVHFCQPMPRA